MVFDNSNNNNFRPLFAFSAVDILYDMLEWASLAPSSNEVR